MIPGNGTPFDREAFLRALAYAGLLVFTITLLVVPMYLPDRTKDFIERPLERPEDRESPDGDRDEPRSGDSTET